MSEALALERIAFDYPGRPLFRDLTLALGEGEFAGLIGPNGSGKSTLLRLFAGLIAPRAGRVRLLGEDLRRRPAAERARIVAMVPQESKVLFAFTTLEVVLMGRFPHLGILGMESAADEALARRCLAQVEMEEAAGRPLNFLSSGERQRVFIARALAQEPRILLLDEPTSFLDFRHRIQVYEILAALNRERGLTVLIVSHDLNLAGRYCRRLHLLRDGELVASGTPEAVLEADRLREIYGTDMEVGRDPRHGSPWIIPYAPSRGGALP